MLLAAVALGRATVAKEGRSYLYSINPVARGSSAENTAERPVQASIAVIGFPGTLEELDAELDLYRGVVMETFCTSAATQIHSRIDAKHPELRFRALLTENASNLKLTLI